MSVIDGTEEDLSYGQALVELALAASWRHEAHRDAVVKAIRDHHQLEAAPAPVAAPAVLVDPRDARIRELEAMVKGEPVPRAEDVADAKLRELNDEFERRQNELRAEHDRKMAEAGLASLEASGGFAPHGHAGGETTGLPEQA